MTDDTIPPFSFPAVRSKKITAAFDGGRLSSDGGVMLLAQAGRRLGIAESLAALVPDRRDPARVTHAMADMIHFRRQPGLDLTFPRRKANRARSKVRSAVETVFGAQTHRFRLFVARQSG